MLYYNINILNENSYDIIIYALGKALQKFSYDYKSIWLPLIFLDYIIELRLKLFTLTYEILNFKTNEL